MNFQHTEDRRMLADTLNRFISEQYGFATRDKIARSTQGFSTQLWARFAELGVIGALFDEASGGFGAGGFDISVVFESIGRGLVVEPFLDTLIVGRAMARSGSDAQKATLDSLIDGSQIVALAHGEPNSHYELARVVTTRAQRSGNAWTLNGAKAVVQHGEHAHVFLVSARTSGDDDGEAGITLFSGFARRGGCERVSGRVWVGLRIYTGRNERKLVTLRFYLERSENRHIGECPNLLAKRLFL